MATKATLRHTDSGLIKTAPIGFSWTTFFFGGFTALFRGDIKWAVIMWIAGAAAVIVAVASLGNLFFLPWVFWLLFAFTYNKKYTTDLLVSGFTPADDHSRNLLAQAGIAVAAHRPAEHVDAAADASVGIETAILRAAKENGGVVTTALVAMDGKYGLDEAKTKLDEMVTKGHAELRIRRTGETVYAFTEMLTDLNRKDLESIT